MGQSTKTSGGLFSALFGFLAFFFQAAAPAPTVEFSVKGDVFCADGKEREALALGVDNPTVRRPGMKKTGQRVVERRRLKTGEYVGEFLDIMA
jgi:hypothetical protein